MSVGSFLYILEEQSAFRFSGRIVFQEPTSHQFLGEAVLDDGLIQYFKYLEFVGKKAIFSLFTDERSGKRFHFLVEPGIFKRPGIQLSISAFEIKKFVDSEIEDAIKYAHLKPPSNRILGVKLPKNLDTVLGHECFSVLWDVAAFPRINDLYINSEFLDHQITRSLVKMRKLDILFVSE